MSTDAELELIAAADPFVAHAGVEYLEATPTRVVARLALREQTSNFWGGMQGGALMTLADSVGAVCAFLNLPEGSRTATTDSSTRFLRPLTSGFATATATPVRVGRISIILDIEIRNDQGALVVKTSQAQAVIPE
ncbi:MAG: PaaI family thioesterase [Actinobacteria bacterium]|nr:PaaI family thioesterase [Actinomycetota bacterium]